MKLYAVDTLHISAVGPENIAPGTEFEVSDDMGRQLVERGLASKNKVEVAAPTKAAENSDEPKKSEAPRRETAKRKGK